jgi:hypothetical protein
MHLNLCITCRRDSAVTCVMGCTSLVKEMANFDQRRSKIPQSTKAETGAIDYAIRVNKAAKFITIGLGITPVDIGIRCILARGYICLP